MWNKHTADLVGLCQRAGKLLSGDALVKSTIQHGKAKLVLLAEDASDRTKKEFLHLAKKNGVKLIVSGTKAELGWAIGKSPRAVIAISDDNFVKGIISTLERGEE